MSKPELAPQIQHFYSQVIDENDRLTMSADGRLEFLRTQEILRRYLPAPPARVLDVGGGTGVHARWLVEDGYQVELIDPVARHVEQAEKVCPSALGDARDLSALKVRTTWCSSSDRSTTCLRQTTGRQPWPKRDVSLGLGGWWLPLASAGIRPCSST